MLKFLKNNYFWICPVFITLILLMLGMVQFTEIDDFMMNEMAGSFKFNAHSEQLMFVNEVFGYAIKYLSKAIPAVNWFAVLYIVSINASYIAVLKVVSRHTSNIAVTAVVITTQLFMMFEITFTVLSFLSCGAAMLWGVEFIDKPDKKNIKHILFCAVLFLCGFGMRNGSVLYCVILVFLPLLFFAFKNKKSTVSAVAVILVICVAASFAVKGVHLAYNSSIPDSMHFNEFNEYRGAASDGGLFDYEANRVVLEKNGITENDYRLYSSFTYADISVFKPETLKIIGGSRSFADKYNINPAALIKELISPITVVHCVFMYIFAFAAIVLFILVKNKRLEIFCSAAFLAAAEGYLFLRRRGVARVVNPIAVLGIFILLYIVADVNDYFGIFRKLNKKTLKRISAVAVAGTVAIAVASVGVYGIYSAKNDVYYAEAVEYAKADKENIYVCTPTAYDTVSDKRLSFSKKEKDNNIYDILGDWWTYTYYWYSLHDSIGKGEYSENGIKILLDDNVLLMTRSETSAEYLSVFFKEHYNIDVNIETVKDFGGIAVYDFSIKE